MLPVPQLVLHTTTVASTGSVAPCDDRPISEDGSKSARAGLDLLHVLQLVLRFTTVAAIVFVPCDDRPIAEDGSKSAKSGVDLLHVLQLVLHTTAVASTGSVAPCDDRPTAEDSPRMAAKALPEAWIC